MLDNIEKMMAYCFSWKLRRSTKKEKTMDFWQCLKYGTLDLRRVK